MCVCFREHPAEHHSAGVHAVLSGGEEQRDGGVRPQPARRRQEGRQPRPPPDPGQDRRGRRRAAQDAGGEERLNPLHPTTSFTTVPTSYQSF